MHHFMCIQNLSFVWCNQEHSHFRKDFFPSIEIPTILHKPWTQQNIPIPPGIYEDVGRIIQSKIAVGVYKPSNSFYQTR